MVSVAPEEQIEGGGSLEDAKFLHSDLQMQVFPSLPIL